ncbi:DUF6624 domain-containing protein [Salininema proteolyticum]|uniref:DUF6624 domain-containing protein n=1 Tax=Salininema proteolyticum TaxID=1607685 RepID=A0ABV8U441_9ACTN
MTIVAHWAGIRRELLERSETDQDMRRQVEDATAQFTKPVPEALAVTWRQVDDDNTAWLKQVVADHGWPLISYVGEEAAHAAWLLAQHAGDLDWMEHTALRVMEEAAAAGEATDRDVAYLKDRVLISTGRPQLSGTQWRQVGDEGGFALFPYDGTLEDVERRRAALGMPTIEDSRPS